MNPILNIVLGPLMDIAGKILDRVIPDKAAAEKAKLEMALALQQQDFSLALEQIKVNQEEAKSASVFVAGWRPAIGWVCAAGLAWNFLGYPVAVYFADIFIPEYSPVGLASGDLLTLALGMLGMAGLRSWEKVKGVS